MNELHVVVIVSQVPEFVCKQLRKTVTKHIILDSSLKYNVFVVHPSEMPGLEITLFMMSRLSSRLP